MKIKKSEFMAHVSTLCAYSNFFGEGADHEKTFQAWSSRVPIYRGAESLAAHLFMRKMDDELLREYLIELRRDEFVRWIPEGGPL